MKNKKVSLITTIFITVIVGAAGFLGGLKYSESQRNTFFRNGTGGQFQQGMMMRAQSGQQGRARFTGGRPVVGEVVSQDDKSITVKMMDGSSKIVILSSTTKYSKSTDVSKADLKAGEQVGVFGTDNADGSVTAQTIQLNPTFRGMQGGQPPTQR